MHSEELKNTAMIALRSIINFFFFFFASADNWI